MTKDPLNELDGAWKVTAYGIATFMSLIGDRKQILNGAGHNIMRGKRWGWFSVEENSNGFVLNYFHSKNRRTLRHVKDVLVKDGDGWKGTLYYRGKALFRFRLDKWQQ
jgi:hypothetical protein